MDEKKAAIIDAIKISEETLRGKSVTAGFDGFTDAIVRIIRKKQTGKPTAFFKTIKQFGEYIIKKQSASFSLEVEEKSVKLGGNMPIMANTMGTLGVSVNCIGAFGHPQPHPVFRAMSTNCHIYSFADPGMATAFEFNDGKMFLAHMGALNTTGWEAIKQTIGPNKLLDLFRHSQMVCLLNWSEIDASTGIWHGLIKDILPTDNNSHKQSIFVDLSDCSKRSDDSLSEALKLLKQFGAYGNVILSLNKNEAGIISKLLTGKKNEEFPAKQGIKIFDSLQLHTLLIHSAKETWAFRHDTQFALQTFYTASPKISTGAGDNFNAGFCTAHLLEFDLPSALLFANAVAGAYVRKGSPPTPEDIISFLEQH